MAPTRSATSPRPAPRATATGAGLRSGPLRLPNLDRLGLSLAAQASTGTPLPGPREVAERRRPLRLRRRSPPRARTRPPATGRSPACRSASTGAIFPRRCPTFPAAPDRCADPRRRSSPASSATSMPRARRSSPSSARSTSGRGKPICYTSADSVFQIAAHETHFGLDRLYEALRDRAKAGRPAQYRPGDRAALRRRDARPISSGPPTAATTRCRRPSRRSSTARSRPGGR